MAKATDPKISYRVSPEFRSKLKQLAASREGLSIQSILDEALADYFKLPRPEQGPVRQTHLSSEIEQLINWWNNPPSKEARVLKEYVRLKIREP